MAAIEWNGVRLELLPERAVWWPGARSVIIADPHFGKAAAFRASGIPVPTGTTAADLARLERVISRTDAARLIVLGDFFHARAGRTPTPMNLMTQWRRGRPRLAIINVRGNHDRHAGDPPPEWDITCVDEPHAIDGFAFRHCPSDAAATMRPAVPTYCGHVHPCAILYDRDGSTARAPCFHFSQRLAVLPAFGGFTGTHPIRPVAGDRVFVIAEDQVFEANAAVSRTQQIAAR